MEQLTLPLAQHLGFGQHQAAAEAASRLALADLATATVTEMTALAGVMGRVYALQQGAPAEVAQAIFESVLPRHDAFSAYLSLRVSHANGALEANK